MRKLRYTLLYRTIQGKGRAAALETSAVLERGDLAEFVETVPYFLAHDLLIPPISVFNSLFKSGQRNAGMSGGIRWRPFEIDQAEYKELVDRLLSSRRRAYRLLAAPKWVKTTKDWHIWTFEWCYGIPSKEHRRLSRAEDHWRELEIKARAAKDKKKAYQYWIKWIRAATKLADFFNPLARESRKQRPKFSQSDEKIIRDYFAGRTSKKLTKTTKQQAANIPNGELPLRLQRQVERFPVTLERRLPWISPRYIQARLGSHVLILEHGTHVVHMRRNLLSGI